MALDHGTNALAGAGEAAAHGADAAAHATGFLLQDGVIMLGAALVFVTLFRRLGLGATLGYIVGGAVVGPYVLGLTGDAQSKMHVADLGIALLLFIVGLELHPSRVWRLRKEIFGLGLVQVLLCGTALAALAFYAGGFSWEASAAIGYPLALSSTAQVLPALRADGELNTPFGERAFSILLFQDLTLVPLLTLVAALSRAPEAASAPPAWQTVLVSAAAILGLIVAGRFVINPLFRLIGRFSERELFVVAGLFTVVASAALMQSLGFSTALGAFIAGVMLAESPYRHELESDVEPFRSILLGLFFLSVGMLLDLSVIVERPGFIFGMAAAVVAIKAGIISALGRLFGMSWGRAFNLGLLLSQGGEFGFVLFNAAVGADLLTPEGSSAFGAIVTLSMLTTPFLLKLVDKRDDVLDAREAALAGPENSPITPAIVVGYGRFGQTVAQMLMARGLGATIIDTKPEQIELAATFGQTVYYGDGTRVDLLRTAGADTVRAIMLCMDGGTLDEEGLRGIADAFPQAQIFVRTFDRRHLISLDGVEIAGFYRDVFESAVRMGRDALLGLRVPRREVDRIEREYRARDSERLQRQSETGDLHAGKELTFSEDNPLEPAPAPEAAR